MIATRTTVRRSALVLAGLIALVGCASTPQPRGAPAAGDPAKVTIGASAPSLSYAVPLTMVGQGIDTKHDLAVDYVAVGASSTNTVAGVLAGEYDFGLTAAGTALDAVNKGAELVFVAGAVSSASVLVVGPRVLAASGITADTPVAQKIAALRGRTIVTSPEGSGNNALFREIVKSTGMDATKDIQTVGLADTTAMVAGIRQGRFDGGFYGSGVLEANVADGSGTLLLRSSDLPGAKDRIGLVLITSKRYVAAHPDIVGRIYDAFGAAETSIATGPAAAGSALKATYFPDLAPAIFDIAWTNALPGYPADPRLSRTAYDALVATQKAASGNDYSKLTYENVVLKQARG
jgi:NitT/TauT family transport system substrate-binding protein